MADSKVRDTVPVVPQALPTAPAFDWKQFTPEGQARAMQELVDPSLWINGQPPNGAFYRRR
jgi:hypothetical protein